jgi:hypothetical protein
MANIYHGSLTIMRHQKREIRWEKFPLTWNRSSMTYLNNKDNDDDSDDIIINHNKGIQNTTVPTRIALKSCM